jgi:hypothetical protein
MNRRSFLTRVAASFTAAAIAPEILDAEAKRFFALDQTMLTPHNGYGPPYGIEHKRIPFPDESHSIIIKPIPDPTISTGDFVYIDGRTGEFKSLNALSRLSREEWESIAGWGIYDASHGGRIIVDGTFQRPIKGDV